ncbi:hypothetical protein COEREDRAFT_85824 [Coemansia reversa NRRL 1564]|uniref:Uncharacterized protein n=1 Tax=Coemansia reversa (strain ATCC 12441 / NRRL 1564) TaxID=763665 RepID=A0A2G5BG29_COERN|nr:hypothetical protein COEREDRAFT_85824 [Coemansia reversa NRRL 1564]|eukprot:PIA17960.1 hypothetical protein COEREDRAFT_85824 [Coemansia reversa NRRL 1564]
MMLGVGPRTSTAERRRMTTAERVGVRKSWSSDEPGSSSNSVSSKESKNRLWSRLRKHASRVHVAPDVEPPAMVQRASVGVAQGRASLGAFGTSPAVVRRPTSTCTAAAVGTVAVSVAAPASREQLIQSVSGLERLKLIAAMGPVADERQDITAKNRSAYPSPVHVPSHGGPGFSGSGNVSSQGGSVGTLQAAVSAPQSNMITRRPSTAAARLSMATPRSSMSTPRPSITTSRSSVDTIHTTAAPPRPSVETGHKNPDDISAESIRRTLGAYTGKTEERTTPRLLRLLPTARRPQSRGTGLACIAEDDEHVVDEAKRFSENSGTTVSSADTLYGDDGRSNMRAPRPRAIYEDGVNRVPSPTRDHPPLLAGVGHGGALPLDSAVYRNTFFNARPAADRQRIESLLVRRSDASDDTLSLSPSRVRFAKNSYPISEDSVVGQAEPVDSLAAEPKEAIHHPNSTRPSHHLSASLPTLHAQHPTHLRRPSEPIEASDELTRLRRAVDFLQSRNTMLSELVMRDPLEAVPEGVRIHIRTLELENAWLRKSLARMVLDH